MQPQWYFFALALSAYTELGYHYDLQILFIQKTMKQLPYIQAVIFQTHVFKHCIFVDFGSASQQLHSLLAP